MPNIETKRIDELPVATDVGDSDLFVVEQSGVAKSIEGSVLRSNFSQIDDVQIGGTSIVSGGVANIPKASSSNFGVTKVYPDGDPPSRVVKLENSGNEVFSVPMLDASGHIRLAALTEATTSAKGAMSSSDKSKLDGIETGANKTTVDNALSTASVNPVRNSVVTNELNTKADKVTEVTVATDGAVTQALEPGKVYHFTGSLTALTLAFATFITAHPVDCVTLAGDTATFSVTAIGDGLTYLWQGLENGQWTDTTFATSRTNTLSMKATAARDGKQYRCVVTDANGNQVISRPATMILGSQESGGANTVSPMLVQYHFDFTTGATAPTLTLPDSVIMPDGFSVEANKRYEVDILNNYGAVMTWAIS